MSRPGSSWVSPEMSAAAPSLGGEAADLPGEVEVAAGDAADVVAGQGHDHLGVGQRDVGVVVGRLGGRTDAVDERETGREVTGAEARPDAGEQVAPVVEAGLADLVVR